MSSEERDEIEEIEEDGEEGKGVNCSMKKKTIAVLEGPILFTSPHGLTVMRNDKGKKWRSHPREKYATSVALQLSEVMEKELGGASFIVWNENVAKPKDRENLDPNYLRKDQFDDCPFHQNILKMKERFPREILPTLNFDCHGRAPRKDRITLEVGMAVFQSKWGRYNNCDLSEEEVKEEVKKVDKMFKEEMEKVFKKWNVIRKQKKDEERWEIPFSVDMDPYFSGWWGGGLKTVSHQCTREGIIGIQLEFPTEIRRKLANDKDFLKDFGEGIIKCYERCFGLKRGEVRSKLVREVRKRNKKKLTFEYDPYLNETVRKNDLKRMLKKKKNKK